MIQLESCELLSEVTIDDFFFKVTLSPAHQGACILWFKDTRITNRFKALGRFTSFDKPKVLQFVVRYAVNEQLRKDIDNRRFECRIQGLNPVFFGQFENMTPHRRRLAYRELFDLDYYYNREDLIRRRKLMAKKFHPDRGGDNMAMTVINQAYEYLTTQAR